MVGLACSARGIMFVVRNAEPSPTRFQMPKRRSFSKLGSSQRRLTNQEKGDLMDAIELGKRVQSFVEQWGPKDLKSRQTFWGDLQKLLDDASGFAVRVKLGGARDSGKR